MTQFPFMLFLKRHIHNGFMFLHAAAMPLFHIQSLDLVSKQYLIHAWKGTLYFSSRQNFFSAKKLRTYQWLARLLLTWFLLTFALFHYLVFRGHSYILRETQDIFIQLLPVTVIAGGGCRSKDSSCCNPIPFKQIPSEGLTKQHQEDLLVWERGV